MNQDDPFGNYLDDDKTVLKPSPGGRNNAAPQPPPIVDAPQPRVNLSEHLHIDREKNPLFASALTLLAVVTQLRQSLTHSDIPGLREQLVAEVKDFETKAIALQCPLEQVQTARYALCSLIDEVVLNTPWGCNSLWTTQGLLVSFHKESWGGEKFFQILKNIINQPETYFNLLEVFYYCLSLGFEGKYKIQERGVSELQDIRENLHNILQGQRGEQEKTLALQWRGVDTRNHLARYVPLWVIAAVGALVILLIYFGFLYDINQRSAPLISQTFQIRDNLDKPTEIPVKAAPSRSYVQEFRVFLAEEISKKQVTVDGENGKTVVRIIAKNFFSSGGDRIQSRYKPLLKKIAQALTTVKEPVMVVGHTDSDPIFTARFPSNWDLSNARAKAVADVFNKQNKSTGKTVTYEGRADTQSLVPNDSPANKALNRRVEIIF